MTRTTGRDPVELNRPVPVGGDVHAYFDGVALWLTSADPLSDEMNHICLDANTFERLARFAKDRVGGEFEAALARVGEQA